MKLLSPQVHGIIDYCLVGAFTMAPLVLGFGGVAATVCYILAAVHLTMTLLTAFPLGIVRLIPFQAHGALEFVMMFGLVGMPWLFGFSDLLAARYFFIASGVAVMVVWFVTDYAAAGSHEPRRTISAHP